MNPNQAQGYYQPKTLGRTPVIETDQQGVPDPISTSPLRDVLERTVDYAKFTSEHIDRLASRLEPIRLEKNTLTPPVANTKPELPPMSDVERKIKEIEMSLSYINYVMDSLEKSLRI